MPGLVFVHDQVHAEDGIVDVRWRGRSLAPRGLAAPWDPDDHTAGLRVVGRWAKDGLRRWVFQAPGIDDCSAYGLWVLDLRGGNASLRRVDRDCYQAQPSILRWTPDARALVPRGYALGMRWVEVALD